MAARGRRSNPHFALDFVVNCVVAIANMTDLFLNEMSQEERWHLEIKECQVRLQIRVEKAIAMRSKTKRKELYQEWRKDLGDDVARESAKLAEFILGGVVDRPKWFEKKYQFY